MSIDCERWSATASRSDSSTITNWPFANSQPLTSSSASTSRSCTGHQRFCLIGVPHSRCSVRKDDVLALLRDGQPDRDVDEAEVEGSVPDRPHERVFESLAEGSRRPMFSAPGAQPFPSLDHRTAARGGGRRRTSTRTRSRRGSRSSPRRPCAAQWMNWSAADVDADVAEPVEEDEVAGLEAARATPALP